MMRFSETIYSLPFAESLRMGKYTAWATRVRFSMEDVRTLVRIVGEFHAGADAIIRVIVECLPEPELRMASRALVALQALDQMAIGERCGFEGWASRINRGRGFLRMADLPEAARRGLDAAAPAVKWNEDFLLLVPEGYEACGKDVSGKHVFALFSKEGVVRYLGPERQRGEAREPSVFPERMRRELAGDKRTRWAVDRVLSAEHLRRLLWLADEFACRSTRILELLRAQSEKLVGERRAVLALELMCRMVSGERFDVDELERRFERGRAHLALDDLPEALRADLQRASAQTTWASVMMMMGGYLVNGSGPGGPIGARVAPSRGVSISTYVKPSELPAGVQAAVNSRLPGKKILCAQAVGPALGAIEHYEIDYVNPDDQEKHALAVSADGQETWSIEP